MIKIDEHKIVSQREKLKHAYQQDVFSGKKKEEFKNKHCELMDYDH